MGLVNRVVKEGDLESTVGDMITRIARNAPLSIKAVKESLIETGKPESEWDLSAHEATVRQSLLEILSLLLLTRVHFEQFEQS
jgi:enoyl-CoA hydratase/carnithine racemase